MSLDPEIKSRIEKEVGTKIISISPLSGGCISDAYKIETLSNQKYFLKTNSLSSDDMFIKEAHGLKELNKPNAIKIPEVLLYDRSFLLTEFISQGSRSKSFFEDFGRKFADLHKFKNSEFGFYEDNYIGSNIQPNIAEGFEKTNWTQFYFNKRLLYQFKLAEKNGYAAQELRNGFSKLESMIETILNGSQEEPSILHGDLWSGNYLINNNGEACLIDPAVYYGHREADLAMTKLFGGFNPVFYEAYNEYYNLSDGYEYREAIYKLYHVLNHLNLFGHGYYSQALSLIHIYTR